MGKLRKTFPYLAMDQHKPSIDTNNLMPTNTNYITRSDDVMNVLEKLKMTYIKFTHTESLDITPCFNHPDSEEAGILFDVLTFAVNFKEASQKSIFNKVMEFIKSNARVDDSEGETKFYFDNEIDTMLIYK